MGLFSFFRRKKAEPAPEGHDDSVVTLRASVGADLECAVEISWPKGLGEEDEDALAVATAKLLGWVYQGKFLGAALHMIGHEAEAGSTLAAKVMALLGYDEDDDGPLVKPSEFGEGEGEGEDDA
jgi:hypothetical protein